MQPMGVPAAFVPPSQRGQFDVQSFGQHYGSPQMSMMYGHQAEGGYQQGWNPYFQGLHPGHSSNFDHQEPQGMYSAPMAGGFPASFPPQPGGGGLEDAFHMSFMPQQGWYGQ